jgi:hypothetical protein
MQVCLLASIDMLCVCVCVCACVCVQVTLTHKFGVLYVADGQRYESEFLANSGGSAEYEVSLTLYLHSLTCSRPPNPPRPPVL